MSYILDSIKKHFEVGDKYSGEDAEGFPDMNYIIGNSSAMDVGEVPTPLDERIGYASQIGGEVMELQITNPATFTLEREAMINTINQLGIGITLHSDMNAGYTTAYKSGQGYGYDTVEEYFTKYLQELAQFKHEVEKMGEGDKPLFNIGRINPHISTTPMPSLSERMAQDVGLDPFGFEINKYDEDGRKHRNTRGQNIYKNPEFLRKLYHTLFLELSNYPFQQYQTFASYSSKFDKEWLKARHIAAWEIFKDEADDVDEAADVNDKLGTILTARQQDQGIGSAWRKILDNWEMDREFPRFEVEYTEIEDDNGTVVETELEELREVGSVSLSEVLGAYGGGAEQLRALEGIIYSIRESGPNLPEDIRRPQQLNRVQPFFNNIQALPPEVRSEAIRRVEERIDSRSDQWETELERALEKLWYPDSFKKEDQNISQEAKWTGLQRHLEVEQIRLFEVAYRLGQDREEMDRNIEKLAEDVFSGENPEDYFDEGDREYIENPEEMHEDMLERIMTGQQFQRDMWKESVIFYMIIPAWMSSSNSASNKYHKGWEAPEFIWETIVESKWGERDDVKLDLKNPRNGTEGSDCYLDLLENNRKFRMDVAAAVGCCYAWGHFTQKKSQFDLKGRDFGLNEEEEETVESEGWTWIDWMNRYGIGVNLEPMAQQQNEMFKVWRPKDIAVAAHAINITTRNRFEEEGELGGIEELNPEIDGRPAKFTIDMEHVATMGAPPLDEMERFIEQEGELAEEHPDLELDTEKPIARILRQMHIMDPGVEGQRGTHHGAIDRGNTQLYGWLYRFVEEGFTRNENEPATILFELAEHKGESSYMMRIMMNLIEIGVTPEELDPSKVDPTKDDYVDEREALMARFFGMDKPSYDREWAKIEEHAFDPLDGLLEAEGFDYTWSGQGAIEEGGNRPAEWMQEEYR